MLYKYNIVLEASNILLYLNNMDVIFLNKNFLNDRMKIILGFAVSAMVLVGIFAYWSFGEFNSFKSLATIPIALVLVIAATYVVFTRFKSYKAGLKPEDEMSKKAMHKAGYYAFLATIYIALGIGFFEDLIAKWFKIPVLEASQATGLVILLGSVVFIALAIYFTRTGVSE